MCLVASKADFYPPTPASVFELKKPGSTFVPKPLAAEWHSSGESPVATSSTGRYS